MVYGNSLFSYGPFESFATLSELALGQKTTLAHALLAEFLNLFLLLPHCSMDLPTKGNSTWKSTARKPPHLRPSLANQAGP